VGNGSLIILVGLFAVLWFVLIRPQKARQRAQQHLLESVAPGDEVLTVGGLYGIVQSIDEEGDLIVEIADGIHVRLARRSVATVVKPEDEDAEEAEEEAEEEVDEPEDDGSELRDTADAVTVPEDDASLEATSRRLFRRRN
jgi:preprotein translocase subunit YajC